jgi:hypothetical protein
MKRLLLICLISAVAIVHPGVSQAQDAQPQAAQSQLGSLRDTSFHGRAGWVLSNGLIQVTVLAMGGDIAEMRLLSDDPKASFNPMLVPPDAPPDVYMGQILCFPSYGPPSPDERRAGLQGHGEAKNVLWKKVKEEINSDGVTLWYSADLPKTIFHVDRAITIPSGAKLVHVQEWVENQAPFDRPINWMEHATFGPPFAEPGKTVLDVSATRGQVGSGRRPPQSLEPGSAVDWPHGHGVNGAPVDLRVFQSLPDTESYTALRMDPARKEQFFALYHPDYHLLIGYVFPSDGFPWIADWQNNRGGAVARGIEFGSSPFDEGLRKSVERASLFDTPTYRWIGGHERLKTEFTVFLTEIPQGFAGVKDAHIEGNKVILTPK